MFNVPAINFYALLFCTIIFYFTLKVKRQGHPKRWNTTLLYIVRRNKPESRKLYLKKDIIYRTWNMKGNTRRCQKWLKHSTLTALKCAGWIPATICEWSSYFKTAWFSRHWGRNGWVSPRYKKKNVSVIPLFKLDLMYIILQ